MATLKDVAKLAGVDVSTVSRALNAGKNVSPETRARVVAAAGKLGYVPNVAAQALRKGRTYSIGVLLPRLHLASFSDILLGIVTATRSIGYFVPVCLTDDDPAIEKEYLNRMRNGHFDGIIIVPSGKNIQLLREIRAEGTAVLQLLRCQVPEISSIVTDYETCAYDAVHYLYGKGCRKIGLISGTQQLVPFRRHHDGYLRAAEELGLEALDDPGEDGKSPTFEYGYACAEKLLDRCPALDAVLTAVDVQGIGAMRALRERNVRVPEDVRVMSLTGHALGRILETGMTAMEIPAREMGAEAVRMVVEDIEAPEGGKPSVRHLTFEASLVEREST